MAKAKEEHKSIELEHLAHSFGGTNVPYHASRPILGSLSDDEFDDGAAEERATELYSPVEERAVIRKLDRRLVLFVALLYMLSFLDRSSESKSPLRNPKT